MQTKNVLNGQVISTRKKEIETLAKQIVETITSQVYYADENDANGNAVALPKNPLITFALLRSLQAAAEQACKLVTEDAINEALRVDKENGNKPIYPGAAEGMDFTFGGERFRLMIHNEYDYGAQTIAGDNGTRRDDPNAALWRAETAVVAERKEKNKVSTKRLAALEATLRQDHPRMQPIETTVSISLRNK